MARRAENIVNNDVFVSFHFLVFFVNWIDFEHVVLPFLESIWNTLGHRFPIFSVLGPCLKVSIFEREPERPRAEGTHMLEGRNLGPAPPVTSYQSQIADPQLTN